jgi:hypothetical protein
MPYHAARSIACDAMGISAAWLNWSRTRSPDLDSGGSYIFGGLAEHRALVALPRLLLRSYRTAQNVAFRQASSAYRQFRVRGGDCVGPYVQAREAVVRSS